MSDTTSGRLEGLYIKSQNIYCKYVWTETVLISRDNCVLKFKFDIFFLQEPPWTEIKQTASMKDKCGDPETGMPRHPDWKCLYPKLVENVNESCDSMHPHVAAYIHRRLWPLKPKLRPNTLHNKDVMLITLNGPEGQINLINAYLDEHGSAIKILCDADLPLIGYLGGDFNCHISESLFAPKGQTHETLSSEWRNMAQGHGSLRFPHCSNGTGTYLSCANWALSTPL